MDAYLLKHAAAYAAQREGMLAHEAEAYAIWYAERFPEGDIAHTNPCAFSTWIRTADTRHRGCFPSTTENQT